jgi:hypothetical protein
MEHEIEISFIKDLLKELPNKNDFGILSRYVKVSILNNNHYISRDDFIDICDIIKITKNKKYDDVLKCLDFKANYYDLTSIDHRQYKKLKVSKSKKSDIEKFIEWAGIEKKYEWEGRDENDDCDKCDEMLDYGECDNPAWSSDGYKCKIHKKKNIKN